MRKRNLSGPSDTDTKCEGREWEGGLRDWLFSVTLFMVCLNRTFQTDRITWICDVEEESVKDLLNVVKIGQTQTWTASATVKCIVALLISTVECSLCMQSHCSPFLRLMVERLQVRIQAGTAREFFLQS